MGQPWHEQAPMLHRLVRDQARRTPDSVAVVRGSEMMSYRSLVSRSGSWASHLRSLGVGVGVPVGIHLEYSLDLPVFVLAVLESGGICLPLSPDDPAPRLAAAIQDAEPAVILTQSSLRTRLPETRVAMIDVDACWPEDRPAPATRARGLDLACLHFTSGSTGRPKGVGVSHAALSARLLSGRTRLEGKNRFLIMKSPINTAPFLGEVLEPLITGGYIVVADPEACQEIEHLGNLVIDHGVTVVGFTPAQARAFLDWPGVERCKSLEIVFCGGEVVPEEVPKRFFEVFDETALVVGYGTTEAGHVASAEYRPGEELPEYHSIGSPEYGANVEILDASMAQLPTGAWGELHLGGRRLAQCYWRRPALTAEFFVPHAAGEPGERLHRSGDIARFRLASELEFKGRVDHQVKVRGFRVDLGEVESILASHRGVEEVAVVAEKAGNSSTRLVACVVGARPVPSTLTLRRYAKERLPRHMVPSLFTMLDALPRLPNGKVDRRALSGLANRDRASGQRVVPPRTESERAIAEAWRAMLGLERVSIHDNFLDLGGDSFQSLVLITQLEELLCVRISPREFLVGTLGQLAAHVDAQEPRSPE